MQSDTQIILLIIFAFFAFLYFNRVIKKNNEAKAVGGQNSWELGGVEMGFLRII